jgi:hypothetical protein
MESRIAAVQKQYVEDLNSHYVHRPRVYGNLDAPLPPLPPFTPHSHRLWLLWSAVMLAVVPGSILLYQTVRDAARLWRQRSSSSRSSLQIPIADDEFRAFRAATGELDDAVARTFLSASAAFDARQEVRVDSAANAYFDLVAADAQVPDNAPPSSWPPLDVIRLAQQAERDLANRLRVDVWRFIGKLSFLGAIIVYCFSSIQQVMSSDAYAVLGLTNAASLDEVKRAFRRQAAELHPDRSASLESADRLLVLQTARDEIVRGLVAPLSVALPEWLDPRHENSSFHLFVFYAVFMIITVTAIVCITKNLLGEKEVFLVRRRADVTPRANDVRVAPLVDVNADVNIDNDESEMFDGDDEYYDEEMDDGDDDDQRHD